MSPLKEGKSELRKVIKNILEQMTTEETNLQTEAVFQKVIDSKWFQNSKRLSVYVSTTGEIQTDSIIKKALEMGKDVFIPQFTKGSTDMEMVQIPNLDSFDFLPSTLWGIRQPDPTWKWKSYHLTGPLDLVISPGVAFTSSGFRCGHGKGYYDRFFSAHSSNFPSETPLKIGLALREQIVESIPVSETDVQLDQVIFDEESNQFK
uniref:5-formyltetrahydrofolate cyclo-ligase n=2 Tax=Caenorhabditis tropicalis TaxID=1561998 RepID=A0A1I7TTJ5_9PELO